MGTIVGLIDVSFFDDTEGNVTRLLPWVIPTGSRTYCANNAQVMQVFSPRVSMEKGPIYHTISKDILSKKMKKV